MVHGYGLVKWFWDVMGVALQTSRQGMTHYMILTLWSSNIAGTSVSLTVSSSVFPISMPISGIS